MIQLKDLTPSTNNPRSMKDHRFVKLVKSLEEFPEMMTKRKITLKSEEDKTILAGNYRYHALKKLGYKEIAEEWVDYADDWTEDQQQEFMLKDNIHMGEWDLDMLANEFDVDMLVQFGLEDFIPGGDVILGGIDSIEQLRAIENAITAYDSHY